MQGSTITAQTLSEHFFVIKEIILTQKAGVTIMATLNDMNGNTWEIQAFFFWV
jgi:hypothetical protein